MTQYPESVPRVTFTVRPGMPAPPQAPPAGDALVIVGCALDGPVGVPVPVSGTRSPQEIFGPLLYGGCYAPPGELAAGTYSGNSLLRAVYEAGVGGAGNVFAVRVGGATAASSGNVPGLTVGGLYPGAAYNGATLTIAVSGTINVSCTQPPDKGGNFVVRYPANLRLFEVCQRLNADVRNQCFLTLCAQDHGNDPVTASDTYTLSGGTYGTFHDDFSGADKSAYATALFGDGGVLESLDGLFGDLIYVPDLCADDDIGSPDSSALYGVVNFCSSQSDARHALLAVFGTLPLPSTTRRAVQAKVDRLVTVNASGYDGAGLTNVARFVQSGIPSPGGDLGDLGRYASVVAGPDVQFDHPQLGPYTGSPAGLYAGLVASLAPEVSATGLQLPPSVLPVYRYTHRQLNRLNGGVGFTGEGQPVGGGAYVTFRETEGGVFVTEDVTCAARSSAFARLRTVRVVQEVQALVEAACRPYIGRAGTGSVLISLDSQIDQTLALVAATGALRGGRGSGYQYQITQGAQRGVWVINLSLRPAGCIHEIQTNVVLE